MGRCASGSRCWSIVVLATFVLQPGSLRAQTLVGSAYDIDTPAFTIGATTGANGDVLALLGRYTLDVLRLPVGDPGPPVTGLVTLDPHLDRAVTALAGGGYAAAWVEHRADDSYEIYAALLGRNGQPTGTTIQVASGLSGAETVSLAPLGTGFALAWRNIPFVEVRGYDANATPLGPLVRITNALGFFTVRLVAVAQGLLALWGDASGIDGRLLDASVTALAPEFRVTDEIRLDRAVANPAGTRVAVAGRNTSPPSSSDRRLQLFAPDGSNSAVVEVVPVGVSSDLEPAFATNDALLAVWRREVGAQVAIEGRAVAASGVALGPVRTIVTSSGQANLAATRRADGDLTVLWTDYPVIHGARVTLCQAGTAVCGDGDVSATCEVCDAGSANSDTLPDACRTDCRPAHCGDGAVDTGELCDDGNRTSCDGCNEFCEPEAGAVCGDGTVAPIGCTEQCDDGNVVAGDGCSDTCTLERIFGGGSVKTDCDMVWRVDNPSNTPFLGRNGSVNATQVCHDGDATCDFDGGTPGSCTFHVAVCVNTGAIGVCAPARLSAWSIKKPTVAQAAKHPELAAVRSALAAVVPAVVGAGDPNVCSADVDIVVPLRGGPGAFKPRKVVLKTVGETYDGSTDVDGLQLRCEP